MGPRSTSAWRGSRPSTTPTTCSIATRTSGRPWPTPRLRRAMHFGVGYFPTHDGIPPGALARWLEERGHESLFFAEHTHIPASRESEWGGGAELPPKYWHMYD